MAGCYKIVVVEIVLTTGIDMKGWRDTLNAKIIKTAWRTSILVRTSAGSHFTRIDTTDTCELDLIKAHTC